MNNIELRFETFVTCFWQVQAATTVQIFEKFEFKVPDMLRSYLVRRNSRRTTDKDQEWTSEQSMGNSLLADDPEMHKNSSQQTEEPS